MLDAVSVAVSRAFGPVGFKFPRFRVGIFEVSEFRVLWVEVWLTKSAGELGKQNEKRDKKKKNNKENRWSQASFLLVVVWVFHFREC